MKAQLQLPHHNLYHFRNFLHTVHQTPELYSWGQISSVSPLHRTDGLKNLKFSMEVCFDELFGGFEWLLDILTFYPYPNINFFQFFYPRVGRA